MIRHKYVQGLKKKIQKNKRDKKKKNKKKFQKKKTFYGQTDNLNYSSEPHKNNKLREYKLFEFKYYMKNFLESLMIIDEINIVFCRKLFIKGFILRVITMYRCRKITI